VQAVEVLLGHANQPPWLIMEWIPDELSSITLDSRDIPTLVKHVNEGLVCIHNHDIAHRDLKPGNILVKLSGKRLEVAKIADFGTAKYGKMQTYVGTVV